MTLLAIVIAILMVHFIPLNFNAYGPSWLSKCIDFSVIKTKGNIYKQIFAFAILFILLATCQYFLHDIWFNGLELLFSVLILWSCIAKIYVKDDIENFWHIEEHGENLSIEAIDKAFPGQNINTTRNLTLQLIEKTYENLFVVIFWFCCLGIFGAVFYRVVDLLVKYSYDSSEIISKKRKFLLEIRWVLQWLPARITALFFAFVGDFKKVFATFKEPIWFRMSAAEVLTTSGLAALNLEEEVKQKIEHEETLELLNRTLGFWLLVIAVVTMSIFFAG